MKNFTHCAAPLLACLIALPAIAASAADSPKEAAAPPPSPKTVSPPAKDPPPYPYGPRAPYWTQMHYWMHYGMPMHYQYMEPEMLYGYQLMTQQERLDYMQKLQSAKTFEEREKLRIEHHRLMQERAKKRGMTLPDMPPAGGGWGPGGPWR